MFAVLARGAHRQALSGPVRCMATQASPPPPPPSSKKSAKKAKAAAAAAAASSAPSASETTLSEASPSAEQLPSAPVSPSPTSLSLDFLPGAPESDGGRTGARSSKDSLSSIERRRRYMGRVALGVFALGLGAQTVYMGRDWEEDELKERKLRIEDAPSTRLGRTTARFTQIFDLFNKPQWSELLPPPLPAPHQKPYTLLLSIDDLLVTSQWDRQNGWRTAKRPGVDYFIAYLSQFYEIVIFTTQHHYTAIPIVEKLDPYNFYLNYKLFRESTRFVDGKIVKDLSYLNRDLSKVIMLDTHQDHVSTHPQNAIVIPPWKGDPKDRGLVALIPFLESIGIYKPPDVRPILEAYHGKNIPLEYAKKEAAAKAKHIEEWKSGKISSGGFTLSSLLGGSSTQSASPVPLTYLEQKRKEAQLQYKEEQAYIQANKANFERLLEEERQAMAREMSGNLFGVLDVFTGGKKAQEDAQKAAAGSPPANGSPQGQHVSAR
ncbi:hypothetical protein PLICRDRAFT_25908 [Plicaturopsis crispa FD-325 SS-3]|nr:hypothetical protein PLICRDRAFT_25908 [Plicaturopsis crispa FD-325 SS-3]